MEIDKKVILAKISNHLILNSSNMTNVGLYNGKIGVILFFFHYSLYTKKKLYREFAFVLLDELLSEIDISVSFTLEDGLCGIGWGIEYLAQNKFIQGDTNEILSALDYEVMKFDVLRLNDFSLRRGISGLVFYVLTRLTSPSRSKTVKPFDDLFISELAESIEKYDFINDKENVAHLLILFKQYMKVPYFNCKKIEIPDFLYRTNIEIPIDLSEVSLGLFDGLAGTGLKQILV